MTFRGRIKNGVVVFDGAAPLAEGTEVDVQPHRDASEPKRGSAAAIMRHAGFWAGDKEEMDRLLAELKEMKWAEVRAQQEKPDPEL
jgi:hypothetical protein